MLPKIFLKDLRLMALSQIANDELESLRGAIYQLQIHDIDVVHPSFLPFLAYIYRVDDWSDDWSEKQKREVVKNALLLFKYKGTTWAVVRALSLSEFEATVTLWYQGGFERGTFKIDAIPADTRVIAQTDYDRFISLVESNKQASQYWRGNGTIKRDPRISEAYAAPVIRTRKRFVSHAIVPVFVRSVSLDAPESVEPGDAGRLVATAVYSNGTSATSTDNPALVTWSSSDESTLTIDEYGNYTAIAFGSVTITATSTEDSVISSSVSVLVYQKVSYLTLIPGDPYTKGVADQVGYQLDSFGTVAPSDWLNIDGWTLAIGNMRGYRNVEDNSQDFYIKSDHISTLEGAQYFRWLNAEEVKFTASNDVESHSVTLLWGSESYINNEASDLNAFLRANKGVSLAVEIEILVINAEEV